MDWATHDHRPGARPETAGPAHVHTYWRVQGPSNKVLSCGLFRTAAGFFEVRCGYAPEDLLRSQVVRSRQAGDDVAAIWKLAVIEKGFRDLGPEQ